MESEKETNYTVPCIQNENVDQDQPVNQEQPVLSKRQLKLLEKRKRWLELKPLRRAKEKEKKKLKMKMAKESGVVLRPSRKMLKASKMANSSCKLKVCFDLSLGHLMTAPELSKTFKQLHRCYSINRRAHAPLQLYITGHSNEIIKGAMNKLSGCVNWDVNFCEEVYHKLFDKSDIIYLTSDSPNIIESFDDTKVYIIGALVDHNRLKNICFENAVKDGVGHARLPLDRYFKFKTRTVLTIDQVYSIILKITEGKTWIDAVSDIVPKRKGSEVKDDLKDHNSHIQLMSDPSENVNNNAGCGEIFIRDLDNYKECDESLMKDVNPNEPSAIVETLKYEHQ